MLWSLGAVQGCGTANILAASDPAAATEKYFGTISEKHFAVAPSSGEMCQLRMQHRIVVQLLS